MYEKTDGFFDHFRHNFRKLVRRWANEYRIYTYAVLLCVRAGEI